MMYCSNCGSVLIKNAKFCTHCGHVVEHHEQKSMFTEDDSKSDVHTEPLLQAKSSLKTKKSMFIGTNQQYYFEKWRKENNWNWASFLLGALWLGYRKMYSYIFILIGFYLLIDILLFSINPLAANRINTVIGIPIMIYFGLQGNTLYKMHMNKKLSEIEKSGLSEREKLREVKASGGKSGLGVFLAILMFLGYGILNSILL